MAAEPQRSFADGAVLAGRYTIVRAIATGGMGEVYEADDKLLGERVALKTVRPDVAGSAEAVERFKREVQLARKVSHPNVCRVHEVGQHGTTLFLSMELLAGETLAERLRRAGRMPASEAQPICEQMCAALAAAHAEGIVHRDFKPGNVMLVPGKSGSRAVVTDFGLARSVEPRDGSVGVLTKVGDTVGSPAYMAPEQVEGGAVSPATDVFALGVVLYEMRTNVLPFYADSSMAMAVKRLKETPTSPRVVNPEIDERWERVILRCLERDPARRYAAATDVARDLRGEPVAAATQAVSSKLSSRLVLASAGALAVAVITGAALFRARRSVAPAAPAPPVVADTTSVPGRPAIAVLGFKNLSARPDQAWLSVALAEMLGTELGAGERLRLAPGEDVARLRRDLDLPEADSFGRETLERIRQRLGVDYVLVGSYLALGKDAGGQIRLSLRLQDLRKGGEATAIQQDGNESDLIALIGRTGGRLREAAGLGEMPSIEIQGVRASLPANPEAARLYAEALARIREQDFIAARSLLGKAIAADPMFPLAHARLSETLLDLGYEPEARAEARKAFDQRAALPAAERLEIEARLYAAEGDDGKRRDAWKALFDLHPDDLEHGLEYASAQLDAGTPAEALATVARLRKLPGPAAADPRIDLLAARGARRTGDKSAALAALAMAKKKAQAADARSLLADALAQESDFFLREEGNPETAASSVEGARALYETLGDRPALADLLFEAANIQFQSGHFQQGLADYEESVRLNEELGRRVPAAFQRGNIAYTLMEHDPVRARPHIASAAVTAAATKNADLTAYVGHLEGWRLLVEGRLDEAKGKLESGDRPDQARLAQLALARGDLVETRRLCSEAVKKPQPVWVTTVIEDLRVRAALAEGKIEEADQATQRLLALVKKMPGGPALSGQLTARIALARGDGATAKAALERTRGASEAMGFRGWLIDGKVLEARARAATADVEGGLTIAAAAAAEAKTFHFAQRELEARLAAGEIEVAAGKPAGRPHLSALAREARRRGFVLIATEADSRAR